MPVPETEKRTTRRKILYWAPWISGLILVAGIVAFLVAHYGTTDKQGPQTLSKAPAQLPPRDSGVPKSAKIDPAARAVAAKFINTAVGRPAKMTPAARRNLAEAWRLAAPELRTGTSYREWLTGNIPVIPYPVGNVDTTLFKVTEQYPNELLLDIALIPKRGVKEDPQLFAMGLKKLGKPGHKRWLVNYWMTRYSPPVRQLPGASGGGPG
jgi:hypothetical protein